VASTTLTVALGRARRALSPWARGFLIAAGASLLVYAANIVLSEVDASSVWGLIYGGVATALMIGAALIGVRRRTMKLGLGRSRTWQQFHVYGGGLFFLFVLMHQGFRLPTGQMTWWLFFLSLWVFLSGLLGVFLQTWIPRTLASGLRTEAVYERIPRLVDDLRQRAEELAAEGPPPVQDFHRRSLAALMAGPRVRAAYCFDVTAGGRALRESFGFLRGMVPAEHRPLVDDLEEVCAAKVELDAHYTLQRGLRWWMALHLPPSIALLVLVGLHIFAIIYW
jgi:hypothetical protein